MNDKLKKTIVGGLAIFGLVTMISSAITPSTVNEVSYETPESHVWVMPSTFEDNFAFIYNKKTGEVRKLNSYTPQAFSAVKNKTNIGYVTMEEIIIE